MSATRPTARLLVATLVLAALVVPTLAGPAGAADRADDQEIADGAVLALADVPDGFEEDPPSEDVPLEVPACDGVNASKAAIDASPQAQTAFSASIGDSYSLIRSSAAVFAKPKKTKAVLARFRGDDAEDCFTQDIEASFAQEGLDVEVSLGTFDPELDDKGAKEIIDGGDDYLGYAGGARVSQGGGEPIFYEFAVAYARVGRGLGQVFAVNTGAVPTEDFTEFLQHVVDGLQDAA